MENKNEESSQHDKLPLLYIKKPSQIHYPVTKDRVKLHSIPTNKNDITDRINTRRLDVIPPKLSTIHIAPENEINLTKLIKKDDDELEKQTFFPKDTKLRRRSKFISIPEPIKQLAGSTLEDTFVEITDLPDHLEKVNEPISELSSDSTKVLLEKSDVPDNNTLDQNPIYKYTLGEDSPKSFDKIQDVKIPRTSSSIEQEVEKVKIEEKRRNDAAIKIKTTWEQFKKHIQGKRGVENKGQIEKHITEKGEHEENKGKKDAQAFIDEIKKNQALSLKELSISTIMQSSPKELLQSTEIEQEKQIIDFDILPSSLSLDATLNPSLLEKKLNITEQQERLLTSSDGSTRNKNQIELEPTLTKQYVSLENQGLLNVNKPSKTQYNQGENHRVKYFKLSRKEKFSKQTPQGTVISDGSDEPVKVQSDFTQLQLENQKLTRGYQELLSKLIEESNPNFEVELPSNTLVDQSVEEKEYDIEKVRLEPRDNFIMNNCNLEVNRKTQHLEQQVLEELKFLLTKQQSNDSTSQKLTELINFVQKNIVIYKDTQPVHTSLQKYLSEGNFENAKQLLDFIKDNKTLLKEYINFECSCKAKFTALHFAAQHINVYKEFKQYCVEPELLASEKELLSLGYRNNDGMTPDELFIAISSQAKKITGRNRTGKI